MRKFLAPRARFCALLSTAIACSAIPATALANDGVFYVGPATGNWNVPANWQVQIGTDTGASRVPTSGDDAIVQTDASHYLSGVSVNLDSDASVANLYFRGVSGQPITFTQSANTMTVGTSLQVLTYATYDQSGGTVNVYGTQLGSDLQIVGGVYNLTGGTLNAASVENNNVLNISAGATFNGNVYGSGTVQYLSSANLAGGDVSSTAISTAANTVITKTTAAAATISGTQTYGANTTYEADDGPTTFQSPTGSSFASANLTIHGNTTKITFDIAPTNTGGTPQIRPTYVRGINFNTPGEGILAPGGNQVLGADNLSIDVADGGSMDMNDNTFILETSDSDHNAAKFATLTSYLHTGFNGGAWNGLGIFSTTASQTFGRSVGLLNNDDGSGNALHPYFQTVPVDAHSLLVQYTYAGDSNLDGIVDHNDFSNYVTGLEIGGNTWALGDFTYDGTVDITNDFRQLADGWFAEYGNDAGLAALVNTSTLTPSQKLEADEIIASVPEPTALGLLALAASPLLRRKRSIRRR